MFNFVELKLLSKRLFRSLGNKAVPWDFKSLNRGDISSFKNLVEKFEIGERDVIS